MPPKRKRADAQPASAPTRSSARLAAGAGTSATQPDQAKSTRSGKTAAPTTAAAVEPAQKKARTIQSRVAKADVTAASGTKAGKTARKPKKAAGGRTVGDTGVGSDLGESLAENGGVAGAVKQDGDAFAPFDSANVPTLFTKYVDEEDPEHIGPSGVEGLCEDAGMPMDGVLPVLLAWQLGSKQLGTFSRAEWVQGLNALKCDTPSKIRLAMSDLDSIMYGSSQAKQSPNNVYHKAKFWPYLENRLDTVRAFHEFIFAYAKGEQRVLEIETAVALLHVSLARKFHLVAELCEFIKENGSYKSLTKDVWAMIFDFGKAVKEDLAGYHEEEAWPTLIDEFVAWKKSASQP